MDNTRSIELKNAYLSLENYIISIMVLPFRKHWFST